MFTGVCRCLQVLIGAYRCLYGHRPVLIGAYRCLQVGTGGHRWQVLGDLQICQSMLLLSMMLLTES